MALKTAGPADQARLRERYPKSSAKRPPKPLKPVRPIKPPSSLELAMLALVEAEGWPKPITEHRFHESRKWRLDFFWPNAGPTGKGLAVETEGGTFSGGRHTRGTGFEADCEKYGEAALMGICVIRVTAGMLKNGMAAKLIGQALAPEPSALAPERVGE